MRFFTLPAALLCVGILTVHAEPAGAHKPDAHPGPAAAGVQSLDVEADAGRVHLLIAETREGSEKPALFHLRSDDSGATWTQPVRVDAGQPPAFSAHRGMDPRIAGAGDRLIAVRMTAGTDAWGTGPLATALSSDGGKTWQRGPNPADDGSTTGHGFHRHRGGSRGRISSHLARQP